MLLLLFLSSTSWLGKFSNNDKEWWTPRVCEVFHYYPTEVHKFPIITKHAQGKDPRRNVSNALTGALVVDHPQSDSQDIASSSQMRTATTEPERVAPRVFWLSDSDFCKYFSYFFSGSLQP